MRLGSAFAGVGGFELGFAGVADTAWQIEVDKGCRKVLAHWFTDIPQHGDIEEVAFDELEPVDILAGGFPCQDTSIANTVRDGLTGGRSGLFWRFAQLARAQRPTWVIVENPEGLLSSNAGRDMGAVLGALGDLGYGFAYRVLDLRWLGSPQRRRRVFVVGHSGGSPGPPAGVLGLSRARCRDTRTLASQRRRAPAGAGDGACVYRKGRRAQSVTDHETWVADGWANTLNGFDASASRATHLVVADGMVRRLTPVEWERLMGFPCGWTDVGQSDSARYRQLGNAVAVPQVEWIADGIEQEERDMDQQREKDVTCR